MPERRPGYEKRWIGLLFIGLINPMIGSLVGIASAITRHIDEYTVDGKAVDPSAIPIVEDRLQHVLRVVLGDRSAPPGAGSSTSADRA